VARKRAAAVFWLFVFNRIYMALIGKVEKIRKQSL
jgi:hypothetical protein